MNSFTRGAKNAFRNGVRTTAIVLILALVMGLTLAMLVTNSSVNDKIADIRSNIGNNITITAAGMGNFGGGIMQMGGGNGGGAPTMPNSENSEEGLTGSFSFEGNTLTNDDLATVQGIEHITSTSASLTKSVDSDDTSLVGVSFGNRPDDEKSSDDSDDSSTSDRTMSISVTGANTWSLVNEDGELELSDGEEIDLTSSDRVAIIGDQLAENNDLEVGDTFTLYGEEITVAGILSSGDDSSDSSDGEMAIGRNLTTGSMVIVPLATLQDLSDSDDITTIVATVDDVDNTDTVSEAITSAIGTNDNGNNIAEVTSDKSSAETTISSLENIGKMSLLSVIICVVVAAVIIFLAMLMVVRERRREIGIMKAIGAKSKTIVMQFVAESLVITAIATVIGLGVGVVGATPLTQALTSSSNATETDADEKDNFNALSKLGGDISSSSGKSDTKPDSNFMKQGFDNAGEVVAKIDWMLVVYAILGCFIIAAVGATAASLVAMKVKPAEAVRAE